MSHRIQCANAIYQFNDGMALEAILRGTREFRAPAPSRPFIRGNRLAFSSVRLEGGALLGSFVHASGGGRLRLSGPSNLELQMSVEGPVTPGHWFGCELGLPEEAVVHFPAQGGVAVGAEMPVGEILNFPYPTHWNAQFVAIELADSVLRIASLEKDLVFHKIIIERIVDGFLLTWLWEPRAPYPETFTPPSLRFEWFESVGEATEDYQGWMERAFGGVRLDNNPGAPDWFRDTRLVVIVDCWLPDGRVAHNYEDLGRLVRDLKNVGAPRGTIIFPLGWHWKFDGMYPEYWPASELGGEVEFRAVVEGAHRLGFKIMPHASLCGCSYNHPDFEAVRQDRLVGGDGSLVGWPGCAPAASTLPFAYIRPWAKPWKDLLLRKVERLLRAFPIEALFFDQTILLFNDPAGDMVQALHELFAEMRRRHPGLLLAGEDHHERILGLTPLSQEHGPPWSGSICLVESAGIGEPWVTGTLPYYRPWVRDTLVHANLFRPYTRFFGHTGMPAAVPNRYCWTNNPFIVEVGHESAFRMAQLHSDYRGVIKTLRLNYRDFGIDNAARSEISQLVEAA